MPYPLLPLASLVAGYLIGSISFGLIAMRLGGAGDIRTVGSGNIGATNVLRTGRRDLALLTLVGDAGKGVVAVFVGGWLFGATGAALAGGAAFLGHIFPVWLKFRGGKGLATAAGVVFAIAWPVGLVAGVVWVTVAALFRFSSLASLVAAVCAPVILLFTPWESPARLALFIGMAILIFIRHRENIARLARREEPRLGRS